MERASLYVLCARAQLLTRGALQTCPSCEDSRLGRAESATVAPQAGSWERLSAGSGLRSHASLSVTGPGGVL